MTQLKFKIGVDNSCLLSITDTTGYQPVVDGFVPENGDISAGWKLSEGYFINTIQYNKHNFGLVLVSTTPRYNRVTSPSSVYEDNFITENYNFAQDGVYTISRTFVISEEVYNRDKDGSRFNGLIVYYSDGVYLYKVTGGVPTKTNVVDLLKETYASTSTSSSIKVISTCFINNCYFKLMTELIAECDKCDNNKALATERDFLFMVLESIKYLKEEGNTTEVAKLLEDVDTCGGYCRKLSLSKGCGCG